MFEGLGELNKKLKKLGTPFVGNYSGVAVEVRYEPDRLVCRTSPGDWIFSAVLGGGFAAAFTIASIVFFSLPDSPEQRMGSSTPNWVVGLISCSIAALIVVVLTCTDIYPRFVSKPRIEVPYASGDILLIRNGREEFRIWRGNVESFETDITRLQMDSRVAPTTLYWISVIMHDGGRRSLCAATNGSAVRSFEYGLEKIMNKTADF